MIIGIYDPLEHPTKYYTHVLERKLIGGTTTLPDYGGSSASPSSFLQIYFCIHKAFGYK
jgi:hypothetical protein